MCLHLCTRLRQFSPYIYALKGFPTQIDRLRTTIMATNPFSTLVDQQYLTAKLAVLEPSADRDSPIKLSLAESSLKDASYECISYDRSDSADTATVTVDGDDHVIPKALESALRMFRRKETPRMLWADLLVGRNVEERSKQAVAQRQILENAEKTLCWLGPDKELTTKAFETIHEMATRWNKARQEVGVSPDTSIGRMTMQQMAGLRERLNNCRFDDLNSFNFALWREIYDVFGAKYWTSVQCISEIVLAKMAIIVCGRSNIRWDNYISASRAMPFYQAKFFQVPLLPHVMKGFEIANSIEIAERRRRLGESIELLPMVQTARDCGTKDARENVFSMLPISTPSARVQRHNMGPQPLPKIDYSKSAVEVFTEAARYTVLERQDLLLWYNERPPCAKRLKDLPSWVPDFSARAAKNTDFNPNNGMRAWWDRLRPMKPLAISDDNALQVQVHPLDRIAHVSSVFNGGNYRRFCFVEFENLPEPAPSETREQRDERFWRTLLLNAGASQGATLADNAPPPAQLGASFHSLLAEERVLDILDCTMEQLQTPEIGARIRENPEVMALLPQCGRSQPYDELLLKQVVGRRFLRTEGGRFGLTAIEDVGCVDSTLLDNEELEDLNPGGGLGRFMGDPMMRMMMGGFQQYLNERDPKAARVAAQAMRGNLPGLDAQQRQSRRGGVEEGDLVVACVGGFFPYVLRPQEGSDSTYNFVGECYLHGSMDGEDFRTVIDTSKLADIRIV
ncbi:hypothetical protein F4779DRAFT_96258 [Xylariaceae sp. FL0662B]|nr:hypothetical protein F4779DRAFT_96258 [Xylariaceae sp. FL0662B]